MARFTVPYADPTLLPLVGLLTALGLTVIYRLDPADARRQAVWVEPVDHRQAERSQEPDERQEGRVGGTAFCELPPLRKSVLS